MEGSLRNSVVDIPCPLGYIRSIQAGTKNELAGEMLVWKTGSIRAKTW